MHTFIGVKQLLPCSLTVLILLISLPAIAPSDARAQHVNSMESNIIFTEEKREQGREQLRRILAEYDLDPWIITNEVKIEEMVDPHSKPILTLNTNFLDSDKMQLAIFIHEQAHWLPYEKQLAASEELAEMFPDITGLPSMDGVSGERRERLLDFKQKVYNHLVVGWVEFDGMVELVGEDDARKIITGKNSRFVEEPYSSLAKTFLWYYERVMEDTEEIGRVLAKYDLIITPDKGLVVDYSE